MIASTWRRYAAFARIASTEARRERGELYGRMAFFAVILGVFSSLWRAVAEAGMPIAADPRSLVWYLAATEWILLSAPPAHIGMQETIRRGDVVYRLGHPASFVAAEFAAAVGQLAVRAPFLGLTAFVCAFVFTGTMPSWAALLVVVPFGLAASALLAALYVGIGLLAFWLQEVAPVYWLFQKLMFVLGGLMLPLDVYPPFIQRAAAFTPFPPLLAMPASFVLGTTLVTPAALASRLALWAGLTACALSWLFRRATSKVTINGG